MPSSHATSIITDTKPSLVSTVTSRSGSEAGTPHKEANGSVVDGKPETPTIYTPLRLLIYDIWVLGIVSTFAWGCSVASYLLPLFRVNIRSNHLDIGVGTGYYTSKAGIPSSTRLTLLDNESGALELAKRRSHRPDARGVVADVLKPLPFSGEEEADKFDSVSMYFLLHCLRCATPEEKCIVFENVARCMAPDGVLTGANILGKGVRRDNWFARFIRRGCLNHGVFDNRDDTAWVFEEGLRRCFAEVETWVVGSVFIFKAQGVKKR
ncbi:MAG: hypothetical protein Q9214_005939 [Letrouitia sp. 1 TL-2023]